ncbi:MAG TPA: enoyl-CoA hydratase-related protein [Deltaproteobacteria bacterium]|nr:enoyl-CoA hydratase-related protein [Deltaproteobacteria bacterium]HOI07834.1 enoyl-CoA hydratase-related protein [Deltaproteobacteria bacterium]
MEVKKAAVIGGGTMGGSIAHLLSSVGIEVFIKDIDRKFIDFAINHSRDLFMKQVKKGKLEEKKVDEIQALLKGGVEYDRDYMSQVDLVIEAVPEIMKLKQDVFAELEGICPERTILATNTSTLSLTEISGKLKDRSRFCGLHFFNPAHVMKLVEVIYDEFTSKSTTAAMMQFSERIGKVPIKVKNGAGFVVNRLLIPYLNEAVLSLMEGEGTIEEIDEAMTSFGMPMGPFALWDLVGLDVGLHASETLEQAFGARTPIPELLKHLAERKELGQKTKKGFYDYSSGEKKPSGTVEDWLKEWWKENPPNGLPFSVERLIGVMIREGLWTLSDGIAEGNDIDTGMVYGTNYPTKVSWGPLHYGEDKLTWDIVSDLLLSLASEYGPERFTPPELMGDLIRGQSAFNNCTYEVDENGVALMLVDNPPMNTLGRKTKGDITRAVLEAVADPKVRVVVLTGKGRAFVAGADIEEMKYFKTVNDGLELSERGYLMTGSIEDADKPFIAAINGFCLGGGLELAMACHIRIMSEKARLGQPEINLGLIPGFAGTQRLPRIVGKAKAMEMILTGNQYGAREAYEAGLVNRVVPHDRLLEEALAMARTIASKSRVAVGAAMESISDGLESSFEDGLTIESDNFSRVAISHDAKEGLSAFLGKRTPDFRDK